MNSGFFSKVSKKITEVVGSPWASATALIFVLAWVIGGFIFGFGDTYQLIINTSTTIITFLMVFVIQSSQNKDYLAISLKIDELVRSIEEADNRILEADEMQYKELKNLSQYYRSISKQGTNNDIQGKNG